MGRSVWLDRYKPAASARTRSLLAAVMWTVVGATLMYFGVRWTLSTGHHDTWWLLLIALCAGLLKSRWVLERSATRAVHRIRERGDGRCAGGFFSAKAWCFVVAMAGLGRVLRGGLLPRSVVGLLYVAVGTALLVASRRLWAGWLHLRTDS